ncbi:MAG: hypothetical protein IVW53_00685 [Chloroflexi bacterium]|nr:hypothetical protein [Chloroflexota bacterium]
MFATLGGSLPAPTMPLTLPSPALDAGSPSAAVDAVDGLVAAALADQVAAGLGVLTDGGLRHPDPIGALIRGFGGVEPRAGAPPVARKLPRWERPIFVDGWAIAADLADRPVKQVLVGPYSLGRAIAPGRLGRPAVTLALAEALNAELHALADAGCPVLEIVEDGAVRIGDDPAERRLFADAQRRLLAGLPDPAVNAVGAADGGPHRTLAIRGGNADAAGAATILDAPYHSYLFDLCAGPDNWRLVVAVPGDRGVIVGAADARTAREDELEVLAFAVGYAASTGGRGHARVGLATSADLTGLDHDAALAKMRRIGEAAEYYEAEPGALARAIDPRAHDIRSAAMGRFAPGEHKPRGRP